MTIPAALFADARPDLLRRTTDCLPADAAPLIYAFCDGPRASADPRAVEVVRQRLRAVDWYEMVFVVRQDNSGLGRSIRAGVTTGLDHHPGAIVCEDDLVSVPGTYAYLCGALRYCETDTRVMCVTGRTHPSVTPVQSSASPYFDGRAE